MATRRKRWALFPEVRQKVCTHDHTPYRGSMPCTGLLICTMCGMLFDDHAERDAARLEALVCISFNQLED